ncbi:hypothetical protein C943_02116 [Mariniradius saccharolyticus AK6]|uniref:Uncharacterized protein n=1 Tax=Mariniradius saccharolyticus AK6 TaxID=1239962 RepID=M7Y2M0_9BACT|nr:hypothetical protein C943_02116 [Mariniradius saccharolyticus AK6]
MTFSELASSADFSDLQANSVMQTNDAMKKCILIFIQFIVDGFETIN